MRTLTLTLPEDQMYQILEAVRSNRTLIKQWADMNQDPAKEAEYRERVRVALQLVTIVSEAYYGMELMKYG